MTASGEPRVIGCRSAECVARNGTTPLRAAFADNIFPSVLRSGMKQTMDHARTMAQSTQASGHLAQLMQRVARREPASLKALYEQTSAKLYGICLRLLQDEAEAQEVLQDVYVTVWRKAGTFDEARASPITWLATIARNRAIDRLRSRRPPAETIDSAAEIADESPSSLEVLEQAEIALRLRQCLDQLEARAREMIRSAFFQGATYPELAEREGVPLPTMKSWIRRGLQRLRGCLEQ